MHWYAITLHNVLLLRTKAWIPPLEIVPVNTGSKWNSDTRYKTFFNHFFRYYVLGDGLSLYFPNHKSVDHGRKGA